MNINAKVSLFFIVGRLVCGPFIKFAKFCTGRRPEQQKIPKYLHMRFGLCTMGPLKFELIRCNLNGVGWPLAFVFI